MDTYLEISNQGFFYNPTYILNTDPFSVYTYIFYQCSFNFTNKMFWEINKVDSYNQIIIEKMNLTNNPSSQTQQIFLSNTFLSKALYQFTFTVTIFIKPVNKSEFNITNKIVTYIRIVSPDIIVWGLPKGVSQITIGSLQSQMLSPYLYSTQIGSTTLPNNLIFKFYCTVIDYSTSVTYTSNNQNKDLWTYKYTTSPTMGENSTCFTTNCKINFHLFSTSHCQNV